MAQNTKIYLFFQFELVTLVQPLPRDPVRILSDAAIDELKLNCLINTGNVTVQMELMEYLADVPVANCGQRLLRYLGAMGRRLGMVPSPADDEESPIMSKSKKTVKMRTGMKMVLQKMSSN